MPPHPLLVLVVDDHRDSAESLCVLLGLWGHEAVVAHDGTAALALATAQPPDVVLLDLGLPGLHGHEVARRLRGLPGCRDAAVWALTGHGLEEDRRRSREAGCELHLVKPLPPKALKGLLEGVARRGRCPGAAQAVPA